VDSSLTNNVMVGVGIGDYEHLKPLPRAVEDVEKLAELLDKGGFSTVTSINKRREEVVSDVSGALLPAKLDGPGTALVLYWSGHAGESATNGGLRLFTAGNREEDPDAMVVTSNQVAEIAAQSGASQLLIVIDTCYSGQGVIDAASVIDSIERKRLDQDRRWVGIVAACRDYEKASDGAMAKELMKLLTEGPKDDSLRLRWSAYQAGLRGDDLLDALIKEWGLDHQAPKSTDNGDAWPILPNPLFQSNAPERVVEHLLWAARGASPNEIGNWFVGRQKQLREIVSWLGGGKPGACVVTGSAGSGKSAVAGRIVSLSTPEERGEIVKVQGAPEPALDPGESSIDVHLQVRGMNLGRCAEVLANSFGVLGKSGGAPNYHDVLSWASACETPPVVVVDGLDEAGDEAFQIATQLLAPLSAYAQVLVASREVERGDTDPSLLESLGNAAIHIDLDADPADTDRDLREYVVSRLRMPDGKPIDERMQSELVADEVLRLTKADGTREGPFLLARIITAQLIANPVDTSVDKWQDSLAGTVEEALDQDLDTGRPLKRDEEELPQAGHELLAALAYSYGSGFPADDVWPEVASALSPGGTEYGRLDAFWALGEHGRYVTASSQNGQAVYRLHERLASSLRSSTEAQLPAGGDRPAATVAMAILATYKRFLDLDNAATDHPYLWYYAWRHAADAGVEGVQALGELVSKAPILLPDLAMALNEVGNRYSAEGRHLEAVAPTEQAVEIYEGLAKENPRFLNDLAMVLNNIGVHYSEVGRHAEAVAPTERAVEIREELAKEDERYSYDLAGALNNLGNRYSDVGRRPDAVGPTERAVEIYEGLAKENPGYSNDLASALNDLGNRYSEVGRRGDAVGPTERAVEIYEGLAKENPGYLNHLASALNNLGIRYSAVGRQGEAVTLAERAVQIREGLAKENPAYLNDLATALNNLGNRYSEMGKHADAVGPTERAVKIYEELAKENPGYLNNLASALNNLGTRYSAVGLYADAVRPTERAVEIREELEKENPGFLPDLASALNNLGKPLQRSRAARRRGRTHRTGGADLRAGDRGEPWLPQRFGDGAEQPRQLLRGDGTQCRRGRARRAGDADLREARGGKSRLPARLRDGPQQPRQSLQRGGTAQRCPRPHRARGGDLRAGGAREPGLPARPLRRPQQPRHPLQRNGPPRRRDRADRAGGADPREAGEGEPGLPQRPGDGAEQPRQSLQRNGPQRRSGRTGRAGGADPREAGEGEPRLPARPGRRPQQPRQSLQRSRAVRRGRRPDRAGRRDLRRRGGGEQGIPQRPRQGAQQPQLPLPGTRPGRRGRAPLDPGLRAVLRRSLRRVRAAPAPLQADEEFEQALDDLIEAFELDPGEDARLTVTLHRTCRSHRSRNADLFDRVWKERLGELQPWLLLDDETLSTCAEWIDTPTWNESREYLVANKDRLISDNGRAALDEFKLLSPDNATRHRTILDACERDGIDEAYKIFLVADAVAAWSALDDPQESKRYLLENRETLLTPEAVTLLANDEEIAASALLDIAIDSLDLACELIVDPEVHEGALRAAAEKGDFRQLGAIATFSHEKATNDAERALTLTYVAIALSGLGNQENAVSVVAGLDETGVDLTPLIAVLTDAISAHAEHAAQFAGLIRALSEAPTEDGEADEGRA
jgi:tetratricopeptide (TPR) repeat protein